MCGVVGAILNHPSDDDIETLKKVFLETEIRGKHASGIAWYNGSELEMVSKPLPISEFLETFSLCRTMNESKIRLIGHIRYSTSDLEYNQPIGDGKSFIVHNGVISQEDPSQWEETYGYECEGKNDTELLFHAVKEGKNFEEEFPGCSVSALYMDEDGEINNFRNGLRPQWVGTLKSGIIIASTKNILLRAGITDVVKVQAENENIHRNFDVTS
jgi:glutamine phosphoribosylpyrophosphate amidotransferase